MARPAHHPLSRTRALADHARSRWPEPRHPQQPLHAAHLRCLAGSHPGLHKLRIEVDNTYQIDVGRDAHSVGEHTQTNWNGIIGRIELRATPPVWIEDAQVYSQGRVEVTLRNNTGRPVDAELRAGNSFLKVTALEAERKVVLTLPPDPAAKKWDEYEGNLQSQEITLTAGTLSQRYQLNFGIRDFTTAAGQFCLNGRPCCFAPPWSAASFPSPAIRPPAKPPGTVSTASPASTA